jgi:hypothetical protein
LIAGTEKEDKFETESFKITMRSLFCKNEVLVSEAEQLERHGTKLG